MPSFEQSSRVGAPPPETPVDAALAALHGRGVVVDHLDVERYRIPPVSLPVAVAESVVAPKWRAP